MRLQLFYGGYDNGKNKQQATSRLRIAVHARIGLGEISDATMSRAGHTTRSTSTSTRARSGARAGRRNPDRKIKTYGIIPLSERGFSF